MYRSAMRRRGLLLLMRVGTTAAVLAVACFTGGLASAEGTDNSVAVRGAHEGMAVNEKTDDLGITVPIAPVSHPGRRYPATVEFPTGPDVGERLPEFTLPNQDGELIDFHRDRGNSKAIVVFYRSAVW